MQTKILRQSGWLLLTVICFCNLIAYGQDKNYAFSVVDTLTSVSMHGRGYVNDGNLKAARYIREQFRKAHLKRFGDDYFQYFSYPMNTFPGSIEVSIDGNALIPGKDFVLDCSSPSVEGVFDLVWAPVDTSGTPVFPAGSGDEGIANSVLVTDANARKFDYEKYLAKGYVFLNRGTVWWHVSGCGEVLPFFRLRIDSCKISSGSKTLSIKATGKFYDAFQTQNIAGFVPGKSHPDTFLVFTAHYDHLGQMGDKAYFPGGNDNASGTAMLLDLIRYFSKQENRPDYSIAFIAFSGEEAGLKGSSFFVSHPLFPLSKIKFLINLDMVGSGSEGIKVVNGAVFKLQFDRLVQINKENGYLEKVSPRGAAANSDHFPFYNASVPSFFIYTLGKECKEYHNIYDTRDNVPFTEYDDLFRLLVDFIKGF